MPFKSKINVFVINVNNSFNYYGINFNIIEVNSNEMYFMMLRCSSVKPSHTCLNFITLIESVQRRAYIQSTWLIPWGNYFARFNGWQLLRRNGVVKSR
jgi:hypothetical protein